jgi:hypothetical protein
MRFPSEPESIHSRSGDGLDGRRRIGSNPAGGGAGSARASCGLPLPMPLSRPDEGTTARLGRPRYPGTRRPCGRSAAGARPCRIGEPDCRRSHPWPSARPAVNALALAPLVAFRSRGHGGAGDRIRGKQRAAGGLDNSHHAVALGPLWVAGGRSVGHLLPGTCAQVHPITLGTRQPRRRDRNAGMAESASTESGLAAALIGSGRAEQPLALRGYGMRWLVQLDRTLRLAGPREELLGVQTVDEILRLVDRAVDPPDAGLDTG